jgi:hypothetical protein
LIGCEQIGIALRHACRVACQLSRRGGPWSSPGRRRRCNRGRARGLGEACHLNHFNRSAASQACV